MTAVLLADVVGYSRLMSVDEESTHARLATLVREVIDPTLAEYGGRAVRTMGDSLLAEFGSALDSVRCALDIQQRLAERQLDCKDEQIQLRIGINTGDVIFDDRDIYGHSINITARLESMAHPGSVCVSQSIYDQTRSQPGLRFTDRGTHRLKNIGYPLRVFQVEYGRAATIEYRRLPRRLVSLAAAVLIGVATLGAFTLRNRTNDVRPNSIVVLPFRNLSSNTDDAYFADAITDDVTTDLSRLSQAFVIASATAQTYKGRAIDARTIARDCGARYLLEGSVRRVDRTMQINVQLIDAETGGNLWADRFVYETATLPDLEAAVTGRIGASLNIQPTKQKTYNEVGTLAADHNPLDQRLRAMALIIGTPTPEKYKRAQEEIEDCLKQDPNSSKCLALLARVLTGNYLNAWNKATLADVAIADDAAQRALSLDPADPDAHYAAGFVHRIRGNHEAALAEFQKAVELNRNFALAYAQISNELVFLGRADEAVVMGKMAVELSPRDPSIGVFHWVIGRAYFIKQDYKEAIDWLSRSVQERPNLWFNRAWLISAKALTGTREAVRLQTAEFRQMFPGYDLAQIRTIYTDEHQYRNETIKAASEHLFQGLMKAGLD